MEETQTNRRKIYSLDHLKPEVVAVAFAKCSRSPESFEDIANELTDDKSADFHEKWVVGYGHSSVAEHANLHMAIENVSILATKILEDNRLASYTEKSTRYQIYDRTKYYKPAKIMESPLGTEYEKTINYLFDTYVAMEPVMREYIISKYPMEAGISERAFTATTKARVCDNIRYLLPTSTLTNLGMTVNARALEHAIAKLLSHPLDEFKEIGEELKTEAMKITPTLIKFANENKYIQDTDGLFASLSNIMVPDEPETSSPVEIIDYDHDAENKLVGALLYKHSELPFRQLIDKVKLLDAKQKEKIIEESMARRASYDQPLRELEHIYYTFDILMDYGAFRDVQRHRMCTQTNQKVTVKHGYSMPEEIAEAGLQDEFIKAMDASAELYYKMKPQFPHEAQYVVPLAYKKRTLFT
ncbi:FAD-dependent thymidylate synthase, partial [Patescibacteria group bacterium]|nr:FAD-dependent thymidylate synthase [Patescibacteria group bacterium]